MNLEPVSRDGLADGAVTRLREAVLEGRLQPGVKLRENDLSQTLRISRAPIREALLRLEQQGLVTSSRYRGKSVVELSAQDVEELVTLRISLERLSWERACQKATGENLTALADSVSEMRRAVGRQAYPELVRMDIDFHDRVVLAAQHERLYAAWSAIKWQVALYLLGRRVGSDDYHKIIVKEHAALLDALREGDEHDIADAVEEHIQTAYDRLKSGMRVDADGDAEPVVAGSSTPLQHS